MKTLGRWHHGASNDIECLVCEREPGDGEPSDSYLVTGASDAEALRIAREHIRETGHQVEQSRTSYRYIYPPDSRVPESIR